MLSEEHLQKNRYDKMFQKFVDGYYTEIYWGDTCNKILIFERQNGKKNCLNVRGLKLDKDEILRFRHKDEN